MENDTSKDLYAVGNARGGKQADLMTKAEAEKKCVFCEIDLTVNKPLNRKGEFDPDGKDWPLLWVWENPFEHKHQSHHLMIFTKRHIANEDWDDITEEEWLQILDAWKWAQEFYDLPGGGFAGRFGEFKYHEGTVRHLHFQVMIPDLTGNVKVTLSKDRSPMEEARRANRKAGFKEEYEGYIVTNEHGYALDDKLRWIRWRQDVSPFVHAKEALPHIMKYFEGDDVLCPMDYAEATHVKGKGATNIGIFWPIPKDLHELR